MIELSSTTIRIFLSVVETRSFAKTGQQLYFSTQTVSQHIRGMEQQLNTTLFIRNGSCLELTKSGAIYAEFYKRYMEGLSVVQQRARTEMDGWMRPIRITISERFNMMGDLQRALLRFRQRHPGTQMTGQYGNPLVALEHGKADLALLCANKSSYSPEYDFLRICKIKEKLIVSTLAKQVHSGDAIDPGCWDLPFYIQAPINFNWLQIASSDQRRLAQYGLRPRAIYPLPNMKSIIAMLHTQPCATLSDTQYSLRSQHRDYHVFDLPDQQNAPWLACCWRRTNQNVTVRELADFLYQQLGRPGEEPQET